VIATLFALLVAVIHVYTFYLESLAWGTKSTNRVFGISEADARASQLMAFNQGFYNLFLALGIVVGLAMGFSGWATYGRALVDYACLSVLGAGLVLFFSRPRLIRPAMIQCLPAFGYLGFRFLEY
jgi:putative membrane protein